jgi:hypothetical protein
VLNVKYRPAGRAPRTDQLSDPLLGIGVVAAAESRIVMAILDIYNEESSVPG